MPRRVVEELFNDQKPYTQEKHLVNTIRNKRQLLDDLIDYYKTYPQTTNPTEKERILYEILKSYPSLRTKNKFLSFIYKNLVQHFSKRSPMRMPTSPKPAPTPVVGHTFGPQHIRQVQQFKRSFNKFVDKWGGRPIQQQSGGQTFTSKNNILTFTIGGKTLTVDLNSDKKSVTLNDHHNRIRNKAIAQLDDTDYGVLRTFLRDAWQTIQKVEPPCTTDIDGYKFSECIQKSNVAPVHLKTFITQLKDVKTKMETIHDLVKTLGIKAIDPDVYAVKDVQVETRRASLTKGQQWLRDKSMRIPSQEPRDRPKEFKVRIDPPTVTYTRGDFCATDDGENFKTNITDLSLYTGKGSLHDISNLDMTPFDTAIRQLTRVGYIFDARNRHWSRRPQGTDAEAVAAARKHLSKDSLLALGSNNTEKEKIKAYLDGDTKQKQFFQKKNGRIGNVGWFGFR